VVAAILAVLTVSLAAPLVAPPALATWLSPAALLAAAVSAAAWWCSACPTPTTVIFAPGAPADPASHPQHPYRTAPHPNRTAPHPNRTAPHPYRTAPHPHRTDPDTQHRRTSSTDHPVIHLFSYSPLLTRFCSPVLLF
jgi:hypothetical protein